MEMILIKAGSNEWNHMWDVLGKHPLNEGIEEPTVAFNKHNIWMYMGSYRSGEEVIHEFRHRHHPTTGKREYLKFFVNYVPPEDMFFIMTM